MDGILNVIKPPGMTSFDVVAHLRGLTGTKKIGHAGTLDPLAAGVLPVCVGKATRAIEFLMDKDKLYRAELTLGVTTDTQDSSGKILAKVRPECTDADIQTAVSSFVGTYLQEPPMYSAIRVGGKRLYDLARNGVKVEREKRSVTIYSADIADIDRNDGVRVIFDIHCSKGTYIRTLCADIGDRLGCGGHMSFLLRKRAGPFDIKSAVTLEDLRERKKAGSLEEAAVSVDAVFENFEKIRLDESTEKKFLNGMSTVLPDGSFEAGSFGNTGTCITRVYGTDGRFIALGEIKKDAGRTYIRVKKFF